MGEPREWRREGDSAASTLHGGGVRTPPLHANSRGLGYGLVWSCATFRHAPGPEETTPRSYHWHSRGGQNRVSRGGVASWGVHLSRGCLGMMAAAA